MACRSYRKMSPKRRSIPALGVVLAYIELIEVESIVVMALRASRSVVRYA